MTARAIPAPRRPASAVAHLFLVLVACAVMARTALTRASQSSATSGRVAGLVTEGGRPLKDALVFVHVAGEGTLTKATSDGTGRYSVDNVPAGTYTVEFAHDLFDVTRRHGVAVRSGESTDVTAQMQLRMLCECIDWPPIRDPAIVTGTITDKNGRPIPNARLLAKGSSRSEEAFSGPNGDFALRVPAGTIWTVSVSDVYFFGESRTVRVGRKNSPLAFQLAP